LREIFREIHIAETTQDELAQIVEVTPMKRVEAFDISPIGPHRERRRGIEWPTTTGRVAALFPLCPTPRRLSIPVAGRPAHVTPRSHPATPGCHVQALAVYLLVVRPIRVVVIDGDDLVVAGLAAVVNRDSGLHLLGCGRNARGGMRLVEQFAPDVVLVRDSLPDQCAGQTCAEIKRCDATIATILISSHIDDPALKRAFDNGVRACLHLSVSAADLVKAIKTVSRGQVVLDPRIARRLLAWGRLRSLSPVRPLSRREAEVMSLVQDGARDGDIAVALNLTRSTVKTYVRRSLNKLACRTRTEAVVRLARLDVESHQDPPARTQNRPFSVMNAAAAERV
jgi:DNA-binding NarL/FixJ family response regulator